MNHKLRVLVRVDADPGQVTLEVAGCLTQASYPALLHIMRRASRLAAGSDISIDLHGASHLDPEILLYLRQLSASQTEDFPVLLREPAELPICLFHVGSDGEVLAGLEGDIPAGVHGTLISEVDELAGAEATLAMQGDGLTAACDPELIEGLELSDYFEGTLDPAATVQALSDAALGQLADALYRHLDTPNPSFGAHTWYELAAEELQQRYRGADANHSMLAGLGLDDAGLSGPGVTGVETGNVDAGNVDAGNAAAGSPAACVAADGSAGGELAAGPALA
ncbi:hypothetical protein [Arthrobacter sp. B3I4]|uniref:hypothetical protein n=1 Tax=Arthrobacter sp. B3I4 TaxID=3042267 RepID=UPI002789EB2D|nr:hypothetical protein [Arthrobacter sp. B3I4]MDQ0754554.1 hypothetical protein [Arthrobacter sp. B3I4]